MSLLFEVITVKTSSHLDWLSITLPSAQNWRQFLALSNVVSRGKGRHGYAHRYEDLETGTVIETGSMDITMGSHFTLSGGVLNEIRANKGLDDNGLVERIRLFDGKVSRIDMAIDVFDAQFTPGHLAAAIRSGDAHIPARTWRFIDGHAEGIEGQTVDTGSSTSDRRFRFYDKRAEQRIKDGEAWVRLELQLRRLYATTALGACSEHGVGKAVTGAIGSYLRWSCDEYQAALMGGVDVCLSSRRPDSNRKKWLLGQVAWALAREVIDDGKFLERFLTAVGAAIERQMDKPNDTR